MGTECTNFLPYIGGNGNWYVNDVDTGVKAQGPAGATGEPGSKGDKGETGAQGPKGDMPELSVNLVTTETGKALDATMGKALADNVESIKRMHEWKLIGTFIGSEEFVVNTTSYDELLLVTKADNSKISYTIVVQTFLLTDDVQYFVNGYYCGLPYGGARWIVTQNKILLNRFHNNEDKLSSAITNVYAR